MKRTLFALLFGLGLFGLAAYAADDSLVGTYSGHLITDEGYIVGVRITITSADGKNVKGSTRHFGKVCANEASIEGTVVGQNVSLVSHKMPRCDVRRYDLRRDGNKLIGKMFNVRGHAFYYEVSK